MWPVVDILSADILNKFHSFRICIKQLRDFFNTAVFLNARESQQNCLIVRLSFEALYLRND